jgi:uncharacterized membrane protein
MPAVSPRRPAPWWPLAALTLLAAILRLSTLGAQSFWYDEAFTPVHVLHPSLIATLRSVVHTENTPPLWYLIAWADTRLLGSGEYALRLPSALAGILTVPLAWAIGRELTARRTTALAMAAFVALNPLLLWYSQEARAYALFTLLAALATLCFLRALAQPTPGRMAAFALSGALALLSHYFAVFLLIPMVLWLLWTHADRLRSVAPAIGALALTGIALIPLIAAQGGHGTQWIGRWALTSRLQAIPQYYLTDYYGAALGHGIELLVALPILAGLALGLWRVLTPPEERGALIALSLAAGAILIPLALVALGADYLAPRNLIAATIPVTALIAVIVPSQRAGRAGIALTAAIALAFLAISVDVALSPRLQRGDWRGLARVLRSAPAGGGSAVPASPAVPAAPARRRAITTVELGAAPLEYYIPGAHNLPPGGSVIVSEIDETGYSPLRPSAGTPPAPGFRLLERRDIHGLIVYRFVSAIPRTVSVATLRRHVITRAHPEALLAPAAP